MGRGTYSPSASPSVYPSSFTIGGSAGHGYYYQLHQRTNGFYSIVYRIKAGNRVVQNNVPRTEVYMCDRASARMVADNR
jgi:hypothetical protein